MSILSCDYELRTEGPGSDISGKGEEFSSPECEIVSQHGNILVLKLRTAFPGGVIVDTCSAEMMDDFINLTCIADPRDTIDFEMVAWELTYSIRFDDMPDLNSIYFMGDKVEKFKR